MSRLTLQLWINNIYLVREIAKPAEPVNSQDEGAVGR